MINLLEQIRAALDELEPRLEGRVVDIEMPRLWVAADVDALHRVLVVLIGRAVDESAGDVTVRTKKQPKVARIEVSGEPRGNRALDQRERADSSAPVARDIEAIGATLGTDGAVAWLTVPLAGSNAPE